MSPPPFPGYVPESRPEVFSGNDLWAVPRSNILHPEVGTADCCNTSLTSGVAVRPESTDFAQCNPSHRGRRQWQGSVISCYYICLENHCIPTPSGGTKFLFSVEPRRIDSQKVSNLQNGIMTQGLGMTVTVTNKSFIQEHSRCLLFFFINITLTMPDTSPRP